MAKSKARKLREKLSREGKMNPEVKRSPFVFSDMRTRTTKTKKDHLYQFKHRNHQTNEGYDGSFYLALFVNNVVFGDKQWTVAFRYRCLRSAGRKSSLLDVPSAGSRPFLYIPQESSAFRSHPLSIFSMVKSNNPLEKSLFKSIVSRGIIQAGDNSFPENFERGSLFYFLL